MGKKICNCHHPELHHNDNANSGTLLGSVENSPKSADTSNNYCYYSKPHDIPAQPNVLIIWAEYQTILPAVASPYFSVVVDVYLQKIDPSILAGFQTLLFRPPIG
jgi:hypothetical protein